MLLLLLPLCSRINSNLCCFGDHIVSTDYLAVEYDFKSQEHKISQFPRYPSRIFLKRMSKIFATIQVTSQFGLDINYEVSI